jgi:hypothetical protein
MATTAERRTNVEKSEGIENAAKLEATRTVIWDPTGSTAIEVSV